MRWFRRLHNNKSGGLCRWNFCSLAILCDASTLSDLRLRLRLIFGDNGELQTATSCTSTHKQSMLSKQIEWVFRGLGMANEENLIKIPCTVIAQTCQKWRRKFSNFKTLANLNDETIFSTVFFFYSKLMLIACYMFLLTFFFRWIYSGINSCPSMCLMHKVLLKLV